MYLLLDDHNIILVISEMCEELPNKGYRISKNSIYGDPTVTRVKVDEIPPDVLPKKYKYEDGQFRLANDTEEELDITTQMQENIETISKEVSDIKDVVSKSDPNSMPLEQFREYLREYNNSLLDKFLKDHPVLWTNGKKYGATNDDQTTMIKNYNGWKLLQEAGVEDAKLEWNAANESCKEFSEADYLGLMGAIYVYAKKMLKLCQWYKLKIINATNRIELNELQFEYSIEKAEEIIKITDGVSTEGKEVK